MDGFFFFLGGRGFRDRVRLQINVRFSNTDLVQSLLEITLGRGGRSGFLDKGTKKRARIVWNRDFRGSGGRVSRGLGHQSLLLDAIYPSSLSIQH